MSLSLTEFKKMYKDVIGDLKEVLDRTLRLGYAEEELDTTLFEDVREDEYEKEYNSIFHMEIPTILKKALKEVGLTCSLYHLKDDVSMPEYVANCTTSNGIPIAASFEVIYEPLTGEIKLIHTSMDKGKEYPPSVLVYYHEV